MVKRRLVSVFIALMLFITSFPAAAQQARRVLYRYDFSDDAQFSDEQKTVIAESLLIRLENDVRWIDFIIDEGTADADSEDIGIFQRALLNGADSSLIVTFSGTMEELTADFALYDALSAQQRSQFRIAAEVDSRYRNLFAGFWYEAVQALREHLPALEDTAELTIVALPGSRIRVQDADGVQLGEEYVVPSGGEFTLELESPAAYRVLTELNGYFSEAHALFLDKSQALDVASKQEVLDFWYVEAGLHMLSFVRFGGGIFLDQNRIRLGIDTVFYQLGIQPFSNQDSDNPDAALFLSLPLWTLGIQGGFDFHPFRWELPIQLGLETSIALRILTEKDWIIDPVFPFEIRLEPGLSWDLNRHMNLRFSLGTGLTFMTAKDFWDLVEINSDESFVRINDWLFFNGVAPLLVLRVEI